jgi:WS/DGAT/MGAT family acyltransferase
MLMLGVLEREVRFDAVLEELTAAGEEVPRFKDFLSRAPLDLAPPTWMPKKGFAVTEQIRKVSMPPGSTWDDALAIVDRAQSLGFGEGAPPWEALLIDGLPAGRALLSMTVHHALSDGTALSLLFANAFAGDFLARSGMHVMAASEDPPRASPLRVALTDRAAATKAWVHRAAQELPELLRSRDARRRELEAVWRHLRPQHRTPPRSFGPARRLSGFRIPADAWKAEAERRGGSVNDLYLAVVAHAMRSYFEDWDLDAVPLQIVMPVNVRADEGVQDGGNVTGVGILELAGLGHDLRDLSEVRRRTRAAKERVGNGRPSLVDGLIQLLPGGLRSPIHFREFATRDVVATNVPMPIAGELCGVPFEMMFMVAPAIGVPVSFSLTSYGEHLYLAANADSGVARHPLDEHLSTTLGEVFDGPVESLRGDMSIDKSPAPA